MTRWPNGKAPDYGDTILNFASNNHLLHNISIIIMLRDFLYKIQTTVAYYAIHYTYTIFKIFFKNFIILPFYGKK